MTQQVINTEDIGLPDLTGGGARALAVLCQDDIGRYVVYVGIVRLAYVGPDSENEYLEARATAAEAVMARGVKQSHADARRWFPGVPAEKYRA